MDGAPRAADGSPATQASENPPSRGPFDPPSRGPFDPPSRGPFEPPSRGPFEPLRAGEREGAGHADYQQADGEAALDDPDTGQPESEIPEYEPIDYEMSELDLGTITDPEAGALGQIRDLYQAAETVSHASLDRHFDQLLERQRKLISEYFTESVGLGLGSTEDEEAAPVAPAAPADASSPFGFDSAQSLTALRGELRGAQ
jgi:hypothetical protein